MSVTREYKEPIYRRDPIVFGIHIGLVVILLFCVILVVALQWQTHKLTQEKDELSVKVEQQQYLQERARNKNEKNNPDDHKIITILNAQKSSEQKLYPQLLDSIEQTWSPRLAILSLKLERAGQNVKLDIAVADLEEAYLFVERLNSVNPQTVATLVRHSTRTVSNQASTLVAHIEIERI